MMENYWVVWCVDGRSPTVKHETLMSAKMEAERLASMNPGRSFAVLRLVGEVRRTNLHWTPGELADAGERDTLGQPEIPF